MKEKIEAIKDYILGEIGCILDEKIPDLLIPTWSETPFLMWEPKKKAFYVSLTVEEQFTRWLPWKDFADVALDQDDDIQLDLARRFEKLAKQMRKIVEEREQYAAAAIKAAPSPPNPAKHEPA